MTKIFLVGTGHTDPYLATGVTRSLDALNPSYVTVERNPTKDADLEIKRLKQDILLGLSQQGRRLKFSELKELNRILASAMEQGEWVASQRWCARKDISCEAIDLLTDGGTAYEAGVKSMIEQLMPAQSLTMRPSSSQIHAHRIEQHSKMYAAAHHYLSNPTAGQQLVNKWRQRGVVGERDLRMSECIEKIIKEKNLTVLVHIGGAAHMISDVLHETLYERLRHHQPIRALVTDFYQPSRHGNK